MSPDDLTPEQEDALFDRYMAQHFPGLVATAPGPPRATGDPESAEGQEDALFDAYMAQNFPQTRR